MLATDGGALCPGIDSSVAFYTLAGGIVGALIAALPGFVDLVGITNPKTKSIAIWHMLLNLLAVGVFAVDFGCACRARLAISCPSSFLSWALS